MDIFDQIVMIFYSQMANLLKLWPKRSAVRRTFRYAKAAKLPLDHKDPLTILQIARLLDSCPKCKTKKLPEKLLKKTHNQNGTYQICRSNNACREDWLAINDDSNVYLDEIFVKKDSFYKIAAESYVFLNGKNICITEI